MASSSLLSIVYYLPPLAGLELARLADLPVNVTKEARRVALMLVEREKSRKEMSANSRVTTRRKVIVKVRFDATWGKLTFRVTESLTDPCRLLRLLWISVL